MPWSPPTDGGGKRALETRDHELFFVEELDNAAKSGGAKSEHQKWPTPAGVSKSLEGAYEFDIGTSGQQQTTDHQKEVADSTTHAL